MILYPLFIAAFFWISQNLYASSLPAWTGWLFPCLTTGAGLIGGIQFPLANRLYFRSNRSVKKVAGFLYASDLLGSSAGALLTSAFLIPILGLFTTLLLLAFYNACGFVVLAASKEFPPY